MSELIFKFLLSYLIGSVMGGMIVGRLRGVDIRASGSQNPGATNAVRTMGVGYGIAVFVIDVGKGLLATLWVPGLALADAGLPAATPAVAAWIPYACALAVFLGHVYPVFFGFRGGKGVATLLGVLACLLPQVLVFFVVTWVLTLIVTGYVGLASILGFGATTVAVSAKGGPLSTPALFMYAILLLVLFTHRANIQRLRDGSESRFEKAMILRRLRERRGR
jgi:glycerol-3-phosphate acyltransferase PlsY